MERAVYKGNQVVPETEQVARRELAPPGMVDGHRAQLSLIAPPVQEHYERASVPQGLEMADVARGWSDHDPLYALFLEPSQIAGLPVG